MIAQMLVLFTRLAVGATALWIGSKPTDRQRIYFANHSSHLDTLALWAALPPRLRQRTRPVAAADYWGKTGLRRRIALGGLHAVLVERGGGGGAANPLAPLNEALDQGASLIIFPEGTRHDSAEPERFKSGLFHLAKRFPEVELIPVYLDNLHRSMPKGSYLPLPFLCRVHFGAPVVLGEEEEKNPFLERARLAILELG